MEKQKQQQRCSETNNELQNIEKYEKYIHYELKTFDSIHFGMPFAVCRLHFHSLK